MNSEISVKEPVVLRLQLRQHGDGFFVSANTDGGTETELLALTPEEIKSLAQLGEQLAGEHLCDWETIEKAGNAIFSIVFCGSVLEAFLRSRQEAELQGRWLRILLSLSQGTILHEIPWEILRQGGRFLACSKVSLVRHLPESAPALSLACSPPSHMLFSTAEPEDCDHLELDAEESAVREGVAASGGRIRLTVKRRVSCGELINCFHAARRSGDPIRIWHHGGHGRVRSGNFSLVLEESGTVQLVAAAGIAQFLSAESDLKLAVLSLCFGGMSLGLGFHLARLGVPAVVGFRSSVVNSAAIGFARSFYKDVAVVPIDLAVARARSTLGVDDQLDWAQPILYARATTLSLWDNQPQSSSKRTSSDPGIAFHNRGVKVTETTEQVGRVFAGERSSRAASLQHPINFTNEDLQTGKFKQVAELHLECSGIDTFAERWGELLNLVSGGQG